MQTIINEIKVVRVKGLEPPRQRRQNLNSANISPKQGFAGIVSQDKAQTDRESAKLRNFLSETANPGAILIAAGGVLFKALHDFAYQRGENAAGFPHLNHLAPSRVCIIGGDEVHHCLGYFALSYCIKEILKITALRIVQQFRTEDSCRPGAIPPQP